MNASKLIIGTILIIAAALLGYRVGALQGVAEGVQMSPALEEPVRQLERGRGVYDLDELDRRTRVAYQSDNPQLAHYALALYIDLHEHWLDENAVPGSADNHRRLGLAYTRLARLDPDHPDAASYRERAMTHLQQANWELAGENFEAFANWVHRQPFGDVSRSEAQRFLRHAS